MFTDDEELARAGQVGSLTHTAIGWLAALTRNPTVPEIQEAASRVLASFAPIEARAHRQNIASLTASYFWHLLPPAKWLFAGAELHLGGGRVDLLWRDAEEHILLDELKAGSPRQIGLSRTASQVARYLDCASSLWQDKFLGIRVLSLHEPARSVFISPDSTITALHLTAHLSKRSGVPRNGEQAEVHAHRPRQGDQGTG